jgi:hypothetical protein
MCLTDLIFLLSIRQALAFNRIELNTLALSVAATVMVFTLNAVKFCYYYPVTN